MKTLSSACAVWLALVAYSPASAVAQTVSAPPAPAAANTLDEISSARKHRRHVRVYRYYDPVEHNRSFGFVGHYPGEYAWRRTIGQTVCDLGYGRWDACDSR
jgi:hypothetical protein